MVAAVSEDDALYIWGAGSPTCDDRVSFVVPGEVSLASVSSNAEGEPLDVSSVSIGNDHIAAIADGQLFVAGLNANGQLGTGRKGGFLAEWQAVPQLSLVQEVACGPICTIIRSSRS